VGVALLVAAWWGRRSGALLALLTFATLDIPHLAYHVTHRADALSTAAQVTTIALLAVPLVFAAALAFGARNGRTRSAPATGVPSAQEATP
jgi:hypothetical protein